MSDGLEKRNHEWTPAETWNGCFTQDREGAVTQSVSPEVVMKRLKDEGFLTEDTQLRLGEESGKAYPGDLGKTALSLAKTLANHGGNTQGEWRAFPMNPGEFTAILLLEATVSNETEFWVDFDLNFIGTGGDGIVRTFCHLYNRKDHHPGGYEIWSELSNLLLWDGTYNVKIDQRQDGNVIRFYLHHLGVYSYADLKIQVANVRASIAVDLSQDAMISNLLMVGTNIYSVRMLSAVRTHSSSHSYGGADQLSVDTRQIANMTAFGRTLVDDATAAEARTTLGAAADSHTHGSVTTDGKIGATAGLPVMTGTGGALQAAEWSTTAPVANGTAAVGTSTVPSRSDHVHPTDTSRAAADHAAQHSYGGADQVFVDTRQITNMSSFARTLVDDATAAEARATLGAAADSATLNDSAASSSLPTAGSSTLLSDLLQQVRNFLRWLDVNKAAASHDHGSVTVDGKIGATAGLPVTTGAGGALQAAAWSTTAPVGNGIATVGTSAVPSRSDHVHPTDTSRVSRGADAVLNGGTVDYWGKVFEITGMGASYNRGVFCIGWGLYNGTYTQGELHIEVLGSDASPSIQMRQLGTISTVLFTAVRNGTVWEIWSKMPNLSYNSIVFSIKFAAISVITGFTTTPTAASVSGTPATVYRYLTQTQSDSALGLVPSAPIPITSSQTVTPVNGACYAINSTVATNLIFANTAGTSVICYVYSTRPTNQNDGPHTLTASNPSGITQTWSVGIGGMSQSANQSGLMCIKMASGYMVIGGMGNA